MFRLRQAWCSLKHFANETRARERSKFVSVWTRKSGFTFLFVVLDQGEDIYAVQSLAAVEKSEFDGEGGAFDSTAELLNELGGSRGCTTGGEQIVANNYALAGLDGVFVDFERVGAVFQGIRDAGGFGGKLLRFSNGDKSCAKPVRQCGSKNEAAGLDPRDHVDRVTVVVLAEPVN